MTPSELDAIQARADAATEGPWETREDGDYYQGGTYIGFKPMHYAPHAGGRYNELVPGRSANGYGTYFKQDVCRVEGTGEDLAFLLASRTDVPALVAEVRRLRALVQTAAGEMRKGYGDDETADWLEKEMGP